MKKTYCFDFYAYRQKGRNHRYWSYSLNDEPTDFICGFCLIAEQNNFRTMQKQPLPYSVCCPDKTFVRINTFLCHKIENHCHERQCCSN